MKKSADKSKKKKKVLLEEIESGLIKLNLIDDLSIIECFKSKLPFIYTYCDLLKELGIGLIDLNYLIDELSIWSSGPKKATNPKLYPTILCSSFYITLPFP